MKQIIPFSRYFIPAAILSFLLLVTGVFGLFRMGFNMGIDFRPGLLLEVQIAPSALHMTYDGPGNAIVSLSRTSLEIIISGAAVDEYSHVFSFASYPTQADLVRALHRIEGISVSQAAAPGISSSWLIQSAASSPWLEEEVPFVLHYLSPDATPIDIGDVRTSLLPLGSVAVQVLGAPAERRFMIRMEDSEIYGRGVPSERIINTLERNFGEGVVVVVRSDFVGAQFARQLADQAWWLVSLTLALILLYCTFRFKFQFALGAVIGIMHAGFVTITFIVWLQIEFVTLTIAALMTVMGYAINDTIVVYDRMRETRRLYPDDIFRDVLNRGITETLSRTVITTFTTMLAVSFLYIFTTGAMKDFALCLLIGMAAGVYSTIFIASGFVYFWDIQSQKRSKRKPKEAKAVPLKAMQLSP